MYPYRHFTPILFIDPYGLRNIVYVVGTDDASNHNVFKDNANTWINDNLTSNDTVVLIDIANNKKTIIYGATGEKKVYDRYYGEKADLFWDMQHAFGNDGIDALIIESHAGQTGLYLTAGRDDRVFTLTEQTFKDWFVPSFSNLNNIIKLNYGANIKFTGCETGQNGKSSLAYKVANMTGRTVWAFTEKTSQRALTNKYGGTGYYQTPISQNVNSGSQIRFTSFSKGMYR